MQEPLMNFLVATALALSAGMVAADPEPRYRPEFHTCAAYFFLAARGHDASRYDALYSAGEFSLNIAITADGRPHAETRMASDSTVMMREMDQDWRKIDRLDRKYGGACEALMRDAHFETP